MEYLHYLDHSLISLEGSVWEDASTLSVFCENVEHALEIVILDHKRWFKLDHQQLIAFPEFDQLALQIVSTSTEPLHIQHLFAPFNVDSVEVALKRIASTARPITDPNLLRVCCKRAIALNPNNFELIGICLCPVGYRILDADNRDDPDICWFEAEAGRLLKWQGL